MAKDMEESVLRDKGTVLLATLCVTRGDKGTVLLSTLDPQKLSEEPSPLSLKLSEEPSPCHLLFIKIDVEAEQVDGQLAVLIL